MSSVQIEQKSYEMPPKEGISIAHFLTVADVERSARYYEKVFGARILSMGDGNAPPYLQLANIWMILNVGGGPTPDKATVTLSVPDPNHINSFMNFRVADIQACYELWKSRGAEFITPPIPKYGEIRCYIRRLHHRSRTEHRPHLRLMLGTDGQSGDRRNDPQFSATASLPAVYLGRPKNKT
jgi:predicted enzyme related to lactoylglutathione lyase